MVAAANISTATFPWPHMRYEFHRPSRMMNGSYPCIVLIGVVHQVTLPERFSVQMRHYRLMIRSCRYPIDFNGGNLIGKI
jgi:hypothetical protein